MADTKRPSSKASKNEATDNAQTDDEPVKQSQPEKFHGDKLGSHPTPGGSSR